MATLDYLSIPSCATRLQPQAQTQSPTKSTRQKQDVSDIRPVTKLRTPLPRSPPDYETLASSTSLKSFATSSALNLLPQMLLSSSLPSGTSLNASNVPGGAHMSNPGKKRLKRYHYEPIPLLSNRDPISIQITTVNFKRFIERVGPVFWVQDRVEEIVFWRRGWKVTGSWLAAYAFICYFPRLVFALPHIIAIAIILATVSYPQHKPTVPATTFAPPAAHSAEAPSADAPLPPPVVEDSVDWQANIQAIQNLMGFYADVHSSITPYLAHLSLSPSTPELSRPGSKSPYTLPILTILILTLPPFIFLVASPMFPARLVSFIGGAAPIIALNPNLRTWATVLRRQVSLMGEYAIPTRSLNEVLHSTLPLSSLSTSVTVPPVIRAIASRAGISLGPKLDLGELPFKLTLMRKRFKWGIQRLIDNNNLSDEVWNSEMREIELWENERLDPVVSPAPHSAASIHPISHSRTSSGVSASITTGVRVASPPPLSPPPYSENLDEGEEKERGGHGDDGSTHRPTHQRRKSTMFGSGSGGWSKAHLRSGERAAWTRGRDGWSGVASANSEGGATVRFANLTFALAPGWVFVDTEDWRADLEASWVRERDVTDSEGEDMNDNELGSDENGWVYTNDSWLEPSAYAYPGAVTRRRRWVRRIWYDRNSEHGSVS